VAEALQVLPETQGNYPWFSILLLLSLKTTLSEKDRLILGLVVPLDQPDHLHPAEEGGLTGLPVLPGPKSRLTKAASPLLRKISTTSSIPTMR
jgi:hypothetical protein